MKFKSEQTKLKLNNIVYCLKETKKRLNIDIFNDGHIQSISAVFNVPSSDIKKIIKQL